MNRNEKTPMKMSAKVFLDYIQQSKSRSTFKQYRRSIALFEEFFGKSAN